MANASDMTKTPTQYMSGRGRYWQIVPPNASWPAFTAVRLNADKTAEQGVQPVMANDLTSLVLAIETFETNEASKAAAPAPMKSGVTTAETKSAPMKDSTKMILWGLGLGAVGLGAYMMMRRSSPPVGSARTAVLDDLERASGRLDYPQTYRTGRSRF